MTAKYVLHPNTSGIQINIRDLYVEVRKETVVSSDQEPSTMSYSLDYNHASSVAFFCRQRSVARLIVLIPTNLFYIKSEFMSNIKATTRIFILLDYAMVLIRGEGIHHQSWAINVIGSCQTIGFPLGTYVHFGSDDRKNQTTVKVN